MELPRKKQTAVILLEHLCQKTQIMSRVMLSYILVVYLHNPTTIQGLCIIEFYEGSYLIKRTVKNLLHHP